MSLEKAIIQDLTAGRSTADSIAGRLKLPEDAVLTVLRRMASEALVDSAPLKHLTVWHLCPKPLA